MRIITENATCANELAKKINSILGEKASLSYFNEIKPDASCAVLLCSLNCSYNLKDINSQEVSEFISKWINYVQNFLSDAKVHNISKIYLWINYEDDNTINRFVSKMIKELIEQNKNDLSIDIFETTIQLMLNSNYAQIRFNYTEKFTKPNIDIIEKLCALIDINTESKHLGLIYTITI